MDAAEAMKPGRNPCNLWSMQAKTLSTRLQCGSNTNSNGLGLVSNMARHKRACPLVEDLKLNHLQIL